jgi:hypothetical protein
MLGSTEEITVALFKGNDHAMVPIPGRKENQLKIRLPHGKLARVLAEALCTQNPAEASA